MKIGILTYHFAINYGALLQCYALQQAFESLGVECVVCHYQSPVQRDNNLLYSKKKTPRTIAKNLCKIPFHQARKMKQKKFQSFLENKIHLSSPMETIDELKQKVDQLDIITVGSDQVFSPCIADFDKAFFLPFSTSAKKASYAASLGKAEVKDLLPFKEFIKRFDFLTVREASSLRRLNDLGISGVETAPDPVFLLTEKQWRTVAQADQPLKKEPYLLCYFLNAEEERQYLQIAQELADKKRLKLYQIVSRYRPYNFTKSAICDAGPEEFLNLIANASFVCTDSFHGTVFSSIFGTNFITFCTKRNQLDQRKQEVLKTLGLEYRLHFFNEPVVEKNYQTVDLYKHIVEQQKRGFQIIQRIINLK